MIRLVQTCRKKKKRTFIEKEKRETLVMLKKNKEVKTAT